jgi:hypothetical protein
MLLAAHAFGQTGGGPPANRPLTKEEALAKELQYHPDIVLAEAKLSYAEAQRQRTRFDLMRGTLALLADHEAALNKVTLWEAQVRTKNEPERLLQLVTFKAELARLESQLATLRRLQPTGPDAAKTATAKSDELLILVLHSHPDILLADAAVRKALALVNKARAETLLAQITLEAELNSVEKQAKLAELGFAQAESLFRKGVLSDKERLAAEREAEMARMKLLLLQERMVNATRLKKALPPAPAPALAPPTNAPVPTVVRVHPQSATAFLGASEPRVKGPIVTELQTKLNESIPFTSKPTTNTISEFFEVLDKTHRIPNRVLGNVGDKKFTLKPSDLPLAAVLLALEDEVPDLRIVVREYGLLVTARDRLPESAVPLRSFWQPKK